MQEAEDKLIKLISKQEPSVRTTFSLTINGEKALAWISNHSKKSIKSVIDSFCGQLQPVLTNEKDGSLGKAIIELAKEKTKSTDDKTRRSMVLSKKSLKILNDIAKECKVPRDALLDSGFCIIRILIENAEEMLLEKHKKALSIINKLWGEVENVENELKEFLDEDDPILMGIGICYTHLMNTSNAIITEQTDGNPIDPDNI